MDREKTIIFVQITVFQVDSHLNSDTELILKSDTEVEGMDSIDWILDSLLADMSAVKQYGWKLIIKLIIKFSDIETLITQVPKIYHMI